MGYHHVDPASVEPTPDRPSVQRAVDDAAGLGNLAVKRYEVEPGEDVPLAYHYHDTQEEVFYVLAGRLHVQTPDGTYEVDSDEVFVAEPDSPHRAYNPGTADRRVDVLAVAAPPVDDAHAVEADGGRSVADGGRSAATASGDARVDGPGDARADDPEGEP